MQPGPPYYPPPAPPKKSSNWIIILVVVLGVGVVGIGVLASLAIYGVRRYLASAKTSEAKNTVGAIARGARASYERERAADELVAGSPSAVGHALCGSAVPVPAAVPRGVKYQPSTADFDTGDASTGWRCLKFSMTYPMYYKYSYTKGGARVTTGKPGAPTVSGAESFEVAAEGDLDGDGDTSAFAIVGQESAPGELRVSTQMYVSDEFE